MFRAKLAILAVVATSVFAGSASAVEAFPADGIRLPVPDELVALWRRVQQRDIWETVGGRRIESRFRHFTSRRFSLTVKNGRLIVTVTWFDRGVCRRQTVPLLRLDPERRRRIAAAFGGNLESIKAELEASGGRRTAIVVLAVFGPGQRRPRPDAPRPGVASLIDSRDGGSVPAGEDAPGTGGADGTDRDDDGSDGTGGGDDSGDNGDGSRDERPERETVLVPVQRLTEPGRGMLAPFARRARDSFIRRLAGSDCGRQDEDDEDDPRSPEPEGDPPADDDDQYDTELRKFGFRVKQFVASPDSLEFQCRNEFDVCLRAGNLADAYRRIRARFWPRIDRTTQERISFRFRPSPAACAGRPPERGDGGDTPSDDDNPVDEDNPDGPGRDMPDPGTDGDDPVDDDPSGPGTDSPDPRTDGDDPVDEDDPERPDRDRPDPRTDGDDDVTDTPDVPNPEPPLEPTPDPLNSEGSGGDSADSDAIPDFVID